MSGLHFHVHAELEVTRSFKEGREILCFGPIFDPAEPEQDNQEILNGLLGKSVSFDAFERASTMLAGRWLIVLRIDKDIRLYPDAGGTRSVFYLPQDGGGPPWIASQPGLLSLALHVQIDHQLEKKFRAWPHGNSWPGDLTPFRGIRQLLPNHWLDLHSGAVQRFGPRISTLFPDINIAADAIRKILHGTLKAMAARRSVALPLTGGYDSRVLYACAGELRKHMHLFCIVGPYTKRHDVVIPRMLAARFRLKHHVQKAKRYGAEVWSVQRENTSGMCWDVGSYKFYTFGKYAGCFIAGGSVSEVLRREPFKDGIIPPDLTTPEMVADASGYKGNTVAIKSFARWFADLPRDTGIATTDLLYWEHRVGNWVAMLNSAIDTFAEPVSPYNCRRLLEIGLGVDVHYRHSPYKLHRRIIELAAPELADVPFNTTRWDPWDRWTDHLWQRVIPWRVRTALRRVRMKVAGFRYLEDSTSVTY